MKQVWIVKAELIGQYSDDESSVCLEQAYDNREDAHQVYARGEKACAEAGITDLHWSLSHLRIEERVEYGEYCVDALIGVLLQSEEIK